MQIKYQNLQIDDYEYSLPSERIAKYPLLTKIKLIGDVYMAAAGLFAPELSPERHADEIIKFGLALTT